MTPAGQGPGVFLRDEPGVRGGLVGAVIFSKSLYSQCQKVDRWDSTGTPQLCLHSKSPMHPAEDQTAWALPPETMIQ